MFLGAATDIRDQIEEKDRYRDGERHVAIRIDSLHWKMFILGGAIACVAALHPTVLIFDPSTVRSMVFVGGLCAIVGGTRLRRRYNRSIARTVHAIVERHQRTTRRDEPR